MADGQPVMPLTDAAYGEQKTFREQQQSAPMAAAAGAPAMPGFDPAAAGVVPLGEPSQRPDEPITAGAPFGPGPGPVGGSPLGDEAKALLPYLPMLERRANTADSSQTLRNVVQYLKGIG
jgi:hypothetical protein